ncbi:MAG: prepilin-type N-terminal cleavage/methylation domain-containing protein [Candidatus Peregrinibacteria bacterium]
MNILRSKKGITLVEVLIAVALFAIVATVSSDILLSIVQVEKKSSVQDVIYEDIGIILQQITKEIQQGTIDYEEYYNYYVIQDGENSNDVYYGLNYGVYGSRFYDPGKSLTGGITKNPTNLGVECSYPAVLGLGDECEIVYTLSVDLNTGQNPFTGDPAAANAFCDHGRGQCPATGETNQLFLIDNTGTRKTIISKKSLGKDDYGIGIVRMEGRDLDQNGIVDTFSCMDEFNCFGDGEGEADILAKQINLPVIKSGTDVTSYGITVPTKADLSVPFSMGTIDTSQFVSFSPLRSSVKDLRFIIDPVEDPYRGYAEPGIQSHPSVTIILTVGLSKEAEKDYPGEFNPIIERAGVWAGVIGRLDSYPPVNEILEKGEAGWIDSVLGKLGLRVP